jgi:hypothetical protein
MMNTCRLFSLLAAHPESIALAEAHLAEQGTPLSSFQVHEIPARIAGALGPILSSELWGELIEDVTLDGFELLDELNLL